MKDLKALNLEKYVGCRVSSAEVRNALVVGYNAEMDYLIVVGSGNGVCLIDLRPADKILLNTGGQLPGYLSVRLVREVHIKETMRDMVGLDVIYQGKISRCVGYNESLNACILQRDGGWAKFSKGDVMGVREDLDAGFEYADYNEVEVL